MIVMKFGGTSVSSKKSIDVICSLVEKNLSKEPIIIVSALSKVTDGLVSLCKYENYLQIDSILVEIYNKHQNLGQEFFTSKELAPILSYVQANLQEVKQKLADFYITGEKSTTLKLKDEIVSFGERMSSFLIAAIITNKTKIQAKQVVATSCIITNKKFGSADYISTLTRKNTRQILLPLIKQQIIPVITGFVGSTKTGEITTLGRGGSDYSASIIGYAVTAKEIQIWTDVDGVYTTDPRYTPGAKLLPVLSYAEASELALFGAKVLHPRTIKPAIVANIPVKVLNTFNPDGAGTTIVSHIYEKKSRVKAITSKQSTTLITLTSNDMLLGRGFLKNVFTIFARYDISVNLISVSEVSLSVTFDNIENLDAALLHIQKFATVVREESYGSLSLVGAHIMNTPHLMRDIFIILEKANIQAHMLSYSATNINVSMVLPTKYVSIALDLFHKHFIE